MRRKGFMALGMAAALMLLGGSFQSAEARGETAATVISEGGESMSAAGKVTAQEEKA